MLTREQAEKIVWDKLSKSDVEQLFESIGTDAFVDFFLGCLDARYSQLFPDRYYGKD